MSKMMWTLFVVAVSITALFLHGCAKDNPEEPQSSSGFTTPATGDNILPGASLYLELKDGFGDASWDFYYSSDDGNTWTPLSILRLTHDEGCPLLYAWFVDIAPTKTAKIRAVSDNNQVAISGTFTIDDELADFMPLIPGKKYRYYYFDGQEGIQGTDTTSYFERSFEILSESINAGVKRYTCLVTDYDVSGSVIQKQDTVIEESLSGLHYISSIAPLDGFSRYYSAKLGEAGYKLNCQFYSTSLTIEKNIGLRLISTRRSTTAQHQYATRIWSLIK